MATVSTLIAELREAIEALEKCDPAAIVDVYQTDVYGGISVLGAAGDDNTPILPISIAVLARETTEEEARSSTLLIDVAQCVPRYDAARELHALNPGENPALEANLVIVPRAID